MKINLKCISQLNQNTFLNNVISNIPLDFFLLFVHHELNYIYSQERQKNVRTFEFEPNNSANGQ
jgi:hypothetical protein